MFALSPVFLGGVSIVAVSNPRVSMLGDSITQYGSGYTLITGTATRDVAGVVTIPIAGHPFTTGDRGFLGNMTVASYVGAVTITATDANNVSLVYDVPVAGAAGTSTPTAVGEMQYWRATNAAGTWQVVNGLSGAGLVFNGNFGQGGAFSTAMVDAMTKCLAAPTPPQIVILEAGVNDVKAGTSAAVTWAGIKALIDQCFAANIPVITLSVEPIGNGLNSAPISAATVSVNASMSAYMAANPSKGSFADTYSVMYDPASGNHDVKANYTGDGVHPTPLGASVKGAVVRAALAPWANTTITPFPTSSSDVATHLGLTLVNNYGPWSGTTTAAGGTGMSGVQATKFFPFRNGGTGTGVCSVIDRSNAALGWWQQVVYTPGGADSGNIYIDYSASLATAGVAIGDRVFYGLEVSASGLTASNCNALFLRINQDSTFTDLHASANTSMPDTINTVIWSPSPIKIIPSSTSFYAGLAFQFSGVSASALTLRVGRAFIRKV